MAEAQQGELTITMKKKESFFRITRHTPWPIYFLLLSILYVYVFYIDITLKAPYNTTNDPKNIFGFTIIYLWIIMYIFGPVTILTRDDIKKMRILKKLLPIIILIELTGPIIIMILGIDIENIMVTTYVIFGIQTMLFREAILILMSDYINKSPLDAYLYSVSQMYPQRNVSVRDSVPGLGLFNTIIFSIVYALVISMGVQKNCIGNPDLFSIAQYAYITLFHQVFILFFSSIFAISSIMLITSPTTRGTHRKARLIFKKIFQSFGIIVYMGFVSFLFFLIFVPRIFLCCLPMNIEVKLRLEQFFRKNFTNLYFYHIYGVKSVLITSILFKISPEKAVKKLIEITNNSDGAFIEKIRSGISGKTTHPLSSIFAVLITAPIIATHVISTIVFAEDGFLKLLPVLLVCTFITGTVPYVKSETIHITVLLSYHEKVFLTDNIYTNV
ncbi:hypothetical protein NEFER03_1536 [Nematocida sp. LUAm3]|nr:hypothetical protein NEFER03_1536 [Nematocida sp. LUAm3]KAI5174569.1 hypothetical protein NEFER02_0690 [Nematocida sp. LUAm2]KAI5178025.1 hypothetical protein NEFER01_1207 [Nematocida sp. LUAm1]